MSELATPPPRSDVEIGSAPATPSPNSLREVLVVSLYFYPEPLGGAPPTTDLTRWLAENRHRVRVVAARPHYPEGRVYAAYRGGARDRETVDSFEVRRFAAYVSPGGGLLTRLLTEATFALQLVRARLTGEVAASPHVVAVCPSILDVAAAGLFRRAGGRFVAIVYDIQSGLGASLSMGLGGLLLRGLRLVERVALNRADAVVTLSEAMAQALREQGVRVPIHVLPPQLDITEFDPTPASPTAAPTPRMTGSATHSPIIGMWPASKIGQAADSRTSRLACSRSGSSFVPDR
jgi:colanic acid biosynthesis glycosyl transferase WcaI